MHNFKQSYNRSQEYSIALVYHLANIIVPPLIVSCCSISQCVGGGIDDVCHLVFHTVRSCILYATFYEPTTGVSRRVVTAAPGIPVSDTLAINRGFGQGISGVYETPLLTATPPSLSVCPTL